MYKRHPYLGWISACTAIGRYYHDVFSAYDPFKERGKKRLPSLSKGLLEPSTRAKAVGALVLTKFDGLNFR